MFPNSPMVVWPAPGFPALLGAEERRVRLIVGGLALDSLAVSAWVREGSLYEPGSQRRLSADVVGIERLEDTAAEPLINAFASLPQHQGFHYWRIALQAAAPLPPPMPRSVALYDLWIGDQCVRPRSVACFAGNLRTLNLAFACDLHLAAFWDTLAEAAERHAPQVAANMLHPQRMWARFVREVNALADRGELDLVVLGGDLVDYVYRQTQSEPQGRGPSTNVHLLIDALAPLRVPSLAIPGNHDYRCNPWRPRTYGLGMVGIPRTAAKRLLKATGLWDAGPLTRRDLEALWTTDAAGRPGLAQHLTLLSPATDFAVTLGGLRLVFASSGRDVLPHWREVERGRRGLLLRSLATSWESPDSEGFLDGQVARIASQWSGAQGAALFFHAPLLHTAALVRDPTAPISLHGLHAAAAAGELALEKRLQRTRMRQGVCFRNGVTLLRELVHAGLPVAAFSGHVHHSTGIHVDRRQLLAHSAAMGPAADLDSTVSLFTGPALGHVRQRFGEPPGYLLAQFHEGRLTVLRVKHLGEYGALSPLRETLLASTVQSASS